MVFVLNPFKPVTSLQQPKEVTNKGPSLPKFLTTKNAGKAVAEPPKIKIGKADLLSYLLTCPRLEARRLFCEFSRAFNMDVK
jgi:hypothetical protein